MADRRDDGVASWQRIDSVVILKKFVKPNQTQPNSCCGWDGAPARSIRVKQLPLPVRSSSRAVFSLPPTPVNTRRFEGLQVIANPLAWTISL